MDSQASACGCHGAGAGRGPDRSAGAGLAARGFAEADGEAALLARRRLHLKGCSVFPRLGLEEVSGVPLDLCLPLLPLCDLDRSSKGRPGAFFYSFGLSRFAPTLSLGEAKG